MGVFNTYQKREIVQYIDERLKELGLYHPEDASTLAETFTPQPVPDAAPAEDPIPEGDDNDSGED